MDELHLQRLKKQIFSMPDTRDVDGLSKKVSCYYRALRLILELIENYKRESFEILKKCINSNNTTLIWVGYRGLGILGSPDAVEYLILKYGTEKDRESKESIAGSLGRSGSPASIQFLLSLLESETDPEILSCVQSTLTHMDPKNTKLVEKGLENIDGYARYEALSTIIKNDPDYFTVDQYIEFTKDPFGEVRGEAFKKLLTYNRAQDLPLFYEALFDNNWHVASAAYKYLSKNLKSLTPELEAAIQEGGGANFKRAIIQLLKSLKDPRSIPILFEMLESEMLVGKKNISNRFHMLLTCIKAHKKYPEAASRLFSYMKDQSFDTSAANMYRYYIWNTLVEMKAKHLISDIEAYLEQKPVDECYAESALSKIK